MGNCAALEDDIAQAMAQRGVTGTSAASFARHIQAVIQGSFVLAKTQEPAEAAELAREQLGHLRRYFAMLFKEDTKETMQ